MYDYSYTSVTLRDAMKYDTTLLDNLSMSTNDRTTKFKDMFVSMYRMKSIGSETVELFKIWIEDRFNEFKDFYEKKLDVYEDSFNYKDGVVTEITHTDEGTNSKTGTNTGSRNDTRTLNLTETVDQDTSDTNRKTGTNSDSGTFSNSETGSDNSTKKDYNLPNKSVSQSDPKGYLTGETDTTDANSVTRSGNESATHNISETDTKTGTNDITKHNTGTDGNVETTSGSISESGEYSKEATETRKGDVNVIEQHEKMDNYVKNIYRDFCIRFNDCFSMIYA